ncbi:MAG: EamA family transporter [Nanoarchaeota archaeon]|nr:EamA family transporter [Nanoarchaeota archaeon]
MNWLLYALASVIFFGLYYVLLKKNLNREHIWVYYGLFFTLLFVLLLPFYSLVHFPVSGFQWALIFFEVSMLSLFFVFSGLAYKHLEESEVSPLGNLGLIFLVLIGIFVFGETVSFVQMIGVLLMVVSAFFLEAGLHLSQVIKVFSHAPRRRKWVLCIVFALFASGVANVIEKVLLDPSALQLSFAPIDPFSFNFITRGLLMVFFLSYALSRRHLVVHFKRVVHASGWLVVFAAILYNLGAISYFSALSLGNISQVIPVASLSTLFVVLVGGSVFHEHFLARRIGASLLMIVATILIVGGW